MEFLALLAPLGALGLMLALEKIEAQMTISTRRLAGRPVGAPVMVQRPKAR